MNVYSDIISKYSPTIVVEISTIYACHTWVDGCRSCIVCLRLHTISMRLHDCRTCWKCMIALRSHCVQFHELIISMKSSAQSNKITTAMSHTSNYQVIFLLCCRWYPFRIQHRYDGALWNHLIGVCHLMPLAGTRWNCATAWPKNWKLHSWFWKQVPLSHHKITSVNIVLVFLPTGFVVANAHASWLREQCLIP